MAENIVGCSEDRKHVAIDVWSPPTDRSHAVGGGGAMAVILSPKLQHGYHHQRRWHNSDVPLIKKVAAEFIGTFILVLTVLSTIVMEAQHGGTESLLVRATSTGLAVMAVLQSVVHISGSHLNPAVSITMAVFGHLPRAHALPYAAAQTLASIAAAFLVRGVYHPAQPAVMATVPKVGVAEAFFVELLLAFVLLFVITAVTTDPSSSKELIAIATAAVRMMNALVAGSSTGPSMNPARTIGAAMATGKFTHIWVYLVATPLGAIAGAGTYTLIKP